MIKRFVIVTWRNSRIKIYIFLTYTSDVLFDNFISKNRHMDNKKYYFINFLLGPIYWSWNLKKKLSYVMLKKVYFNEFFKCTFLNEK